jgi:cbb3-type cytochrome oxidase subunit 3
MTGYWFLDLLIILFLCYCLWAYWPGNLERIKRSRSRLQAKHQQLKELERKMKKV